MSNDFWARQRAKVNPPQPVVSNSQPWWARGTDLLTQRETVAQQPLQSPTEPVLNDDRHIDGHDVSQADILKGNAEECPRCPRDPRTGIRGNMYRPTPSAVLRCFDCGYMYGRYFGEGQSKLATVEGQSQMARQTVSGGGQGSNFQGKIKSPDDPRIVGRIQ